MAKEEHLAGARLSLTAGRYRRRIIIYTFIPPDRRLTPIICMMGRGRGGRETTGKTGEEQECGKGEGGLKGKRGMKRLTHRSSHGGALGTPSGPTRPHRPSPRRPCRPCPSAPSSSWRAWHLAPCPSGARRWARRCRAGYMESVLAKSGGRE
jgi:hypothetical protein